MDISKLYAGMTTNLLRAYKLADQVSKSGEITPLELSEVQECMGHIRFALGGIVCCELMNDKIDVVIPSI